MAREQNEMQEQLMQKFNKKIESTMTKTNLARHAKNQERFYEMQDMGNAQVQYPSQNQAQNRIDQTGQLKHYIDYDLDATGGDPRSDGSNLQF